MNTNIIIPIYNRDTWISGNLQNKQSLSAHFTYKSLNLLIVAMPNLRTNTHRNPRESSVTLGEVIFFGMLNNNMYMYKKSV